MSSVISISNRRIVIGVVLHPNGTTSTAFLPIARLNQHMSAPAIWEGQTATLFFRYQPSERKTFNQAATDLFDRDGFSNSGDAIVVTGCEKWPCLRVYGSQHEIEDEIEHLTLGDHAVVPTSGMDTRQDIIARSENDILSIKMAL